MRNALCFYNIRLFHLKCPAPMKKISFFVFLLFFACNDSSDTSKTTLPKAKSVNQDSSTRVLYKEYKEGKELFSPAQIYELGKLNPVDEAQNDTVFFVFREKLLDAVRKKDIFYLLDQLDPNIKVNFGEGSGVEAFTQAWQLTSEEKTKVSPLWEELEKTLELGGAFDKTNDLFLSNYIFATMDEPYDAYIHAAVVGSGVRYRSAPNLQSKVVGRLSFDIVEILDRNGPTETIGGETYPWIKIKTLAGKEGYIFGKYIVSPIDYRAGFKKINGIWKMTFFVAGD